MKKKVIATQACAGLTLIEVVLALAILGISIFVLTEATSKCLAVARSAKNYQTARMVLDQGELDFPLSATNSPEQNAVDEKEYPKGFTFSRKLDPVDGETKLYIVTTRVRWSEKGRNSFEELVSYMHFPNEK